MTELNLTLAAIALACLVTSPAARAENKTPDNKAAAHGTEISPMSGSINAVKFVEPVNGAKVPEKFKVKMAVEGYSIAPLGTMTKNTGHHHLLIDSGPVAEGGIVPTDKTHMHFGKGQTETELELPPGHHKLTLQFADGAHRSYGPAMSQTIEVDVAAKKM